MEAAKSVFLEKGFEKTTMEDIIAETSLSKGGFYHYYASTTDILHDLMIEGIAYRINIIKQTVGQASAWDDESVVDMMVDKVLDESDLMSLYVIYLQASQRNQTLRDLFQELKKDFNRCQSENQRLKVENEQLLQKCSILQKEVDTLKKRLDRKEIALLKKL